MKVIVSHEKVRIVKIMRLYEVQERNERGEWEKIWLGGQYFWFGSKVLNEFKQTVLKYA